MALSPILRTLTLFTLTFTLLAPAPARADEVSDQMNVLSSKWRATCKGDPFASRLERHSFSAQKRITIHYTDTPKTYKRTLTEKLCILFNYATTKIEGTKKVLWGDIPYHFYISSDGQAGEARNTAYQVDSNTAYQRDGHITIVVEGNQNDGITGAQKKKLFAIVGALQRKFDIPSSRIATHKDFAQTDCPGPSVLAAVAEYKSIGNKACRGVVCRPKPRCAASQNLVNKAKPEACCAIWKCEAKTQDEEDEEDDESEQNRIHALKLAREKQKSKTKWFSSKPQPRWNPFEGQQF